MTSPPHAFLLVVSGPRQGERFELTAASTTFGRVAGEGIDIVLSDDTISRRHCHITRSGTTYLVEDRHSTSGIFINGERCSSRILADGDALHLGACKMRFSLSRE